VGNGDTNVGPNIHYKQITHSLPNFTTFFQLSIVDYVLTIT